MDSIRRNGGKIIRWEWEEMQGQRMSVGVEERRAWDNENKNKKREGNKNACV